MSSSTLAAPTPQRGTGVALGPDDTTTEEPPDLSSLHISSPSMSALNKLAPIAVAVPEQRQSSAPQAIASSAAAGYVVPALASSLDSTFRRVYADRKLSPIIPHSPSVADSVGGSASDYDNEHEPDSPSSLSSWNSWAGGRRGDLADVEDLELDGLTAIEPELETVSELDEESSAYMSGSDRPVADSEDDDGHQLSLRYTNSGRQQANGVTADASPRRKVHHLSNNVTPHPHHPHYAHHVSHLHPNGTPLHPHFSPRAGGHGLSHASRYHLRAPPNLAARRRKGRLAELAEEGTSGAISSTKMPTSSSSPSPEALSPNDVVSPPASDSHEVVSQTGHAQESAFTASGDPSSVELEIFGPPPIPVRSVSPSETVPAYPSPLCVCLTADEQGEVTEVYQDETPTGEQKELIVKSQDEDALDEDARSRLGGNSTPTPPSPTTSGRSVDTLAATASTPPTSPPSSPQLGRKGSLRNRRASSPGRTKPKFPLRPCFKRRSTEKGAPAATANTSRDSSSEREKAPSRGRTKVRFSQAPPMEVRTHSPVEYDRKACPVSNRLSPEDLEELRTMKMEMGLLEAKCAALAACKPEHRLHFANSFGGVDAASSESESDSHGAPSSSLSDARRRADSISSSSPTSYCGSRFAKRGESSQQRMTPAEYLRMEREKERERVCRMAGIGTGVGFRYSGGDGGPKTRQMPHGGCEAFGASSIISRFGLSKPPPPLPGMSAPSNSFHTTPVPSTPNAGSPSSGGGPHVPSYQDVHDDHLGFRGGASLYRPNSAPPVRGPDASTFSALQEDVADADAGQGHQTIDNRDEDRPRGRQMEKAGGRGGNLKSTSTDATLTEADMNAMRSSNVPSFLRTCPSPTSRSSHSPESIRSLSPATARFDYLSHPDPNAKPTRPNIRPLSNSHSSPSYEMMPTSTSCGYDSPASEFCYESGSEYDLLG